jgi:hypothetical protein
LVCGDREHNLCFSDAVMPRAYHIRALMIDGSHFWVNETDSALTFDKWRDTCSQYATHEIDAAIMRLSFNQPRLEFTTVEVAKPLRLNKGSATLARNFDWSGVLKLLYEG